MGGGRFVNLTVAHRLKLNGVLPIENDPLDSVWKPAALHPVQDHITHGNLSGHGFGAAFRVNDAGEPVQLRGVIGCAGGGHSRAAQIGVPFHLTAQRFAHQPQGDIGHAAFHGDAA